MTDTQALKIVLEHRLAELKQRAIRIEADMTTPMNADSEEQATEAADDEALASEDVMVTREIAAVIAAITRIDTGHYGKCATCGADIPPARLVAMPEALFCMECAQT